MNAVSARAHMKIPDRVCPNATESFEKSSKRKVFFSYSRADLMSVLSVVRACRHLGLSTWIDVENLRPGERWKEAIDAALNIADGFVFCLSPLSLESAWTSVELKVALTRGIRVIPIMLRPVNIEHLPPSLRERQIFDSEAWPATERPMRTASAIASALDARPTLETDSCGHGDFGPEGIDLDSTTISVFLTCTRRSKIFLQENYSRQWSFRLLNPSTLSEILADTSATSNLTISVTGHADPHGVNLLLGAIGAGRKRGRVTLVEEGGTAVFKRSATLASIEYASPCPSDPVLPLVPPRPSAG
jgi:hypothetical protein